MTESKHPTIVVGVDGSRAAIRAALWAADEAVARDIPLRLLHVVAAETASDLASARAALHDARAAVEASGKPVKIETDTPGGRPLAALIAASRAAAMVCVGAIGHGRSRGNVGAVATGLASGAHCPVAIVRHQDGRDATTPGWIVVAADDSPGNSAVIQRGVDEARLREAPLHVVAAWRTAAVAVDDHAVADGNARIRAQLDRRLTQWLRSYPDVEIHPVAVHDSFVNYIVRHADSSQLVVIGSRRYDDGHDLLGFVGYTALHHTGCSVLVTGARHL